MSAVILFTTCPNRKLAEKIALTLVEEKLVACVQIGSEISSVYRWRDKLERAKEIPLSAKTTQIKASQAILKIRELQPFEIPEILSIPVQDGFKPYLEWIAASTNTN